MSIPLSYFLFAYYGFLALWTIFFLVGLYHMLKFGFKNVLTLLSTAVISLVAAAMLFASFYFISRIDYWERHVQIGPAWNNETLEF